MFREREAEGTMRTDPTTRRGWEDLARAAADVEDDAPALAALTGVVLALEQAADASLGAADGERLVVLQRRFARAHRLGAATVGPDQVQQHLSALRWAAPAPTPVLSNEVPVLAGTPAAADWCRA
jgi:hypothetical protein